MLPPYTLDQTIEKIVKEEWGRILSCVTKNVGDIQLAEDSLQDAVEAALTHWKKNGLPKSPAAWLISVSHRKAIDRLRRLKTFENKQADLQYLTHMTLLDQSTSSASAIPDERLEMIFTCCHPALEEKTRVALTLRTIGGLKTEEIARAFLDTPTAMAQRLVRAKKKIKLAGIPYKIPDQQMMPSRLQGVLAVIYLIFNEGYAASSGDALTRIDLIDEAIRLARILMQLLPNEAEVAGLYALLLLHDARRFARLDKQGQMVALEFQNRNLWDKSRFDEGCRIIKQSLALQAIGPYQLQACISALHGEATNWESTDWQQIAALYALLYKLQPTSVVKINHALAVSYAYSVAEALEMLAQLDCNSNTQNHVSFLLAKADLFYRSDRREEAAQLLEKAVPFTKNHIEKDFIQRKLKDWLKSK